jgi:hypothetical protein
MLARLAQNLILGLVMGTIYWNIPLASYNTRYGVIYGVLVNVGLKSVASIPIMYDHRSGASEDPAYQHHTKGPRATRQHHPHLPAYPAP